MCPNPPPPPSPAPLSTSTPTPSRPPSSTPPPNAASSSAPGNGASPPSSPAKAVHRAFTTPNSLILIAGPGDRQSRLLLDKASAFLTHLRLPRRRAGGPDPAIVLPNHSRIVALPADPATIRGFSAVNMILIDEASRVPDALYTALQPMLAVSDGDLWLLSTPAGKTGFFYDIWTHAGADWDRYSVAAPDCPRISPAWLARQRHEIDDLSFRQEYLCEFLDDSASRFPRDLVEAALTDLEQPL